MSEKSVSRWSWVMIFAGVVAVRVLLLLRGTAAGIYNTDELIMLWSSVGLLFNATSTQLVWPATIIQLLVYPVVLVDLFIHLMTNATGGISGYLLSIQEYIAGVGFEPQRLLQPLRYWMVLITTLPLLFAVKPARKLLGELPAMLIIALMGISPLVVQEALMFKADGLAVTLFLPVLLWTLVLVRSTQRGWDIRLIGVIAAFAAVLTARLNYIPFILVPPAILWFRHSREESAREAAVLGRWQGLLTMLGVFVLVLLAFFPQTWTQSITFAKTFFGNYLSFKSGMPADHLLLFKYSERWFGIFMVPVFLYGGYRAFREFDRRLFWVLIASLGLMLLPIVTANFYFARHTLQIIPIVLVFVVVGLNDLMHRLPRIVGSLLLALLLILSLGRTVTLHETNHAPGLERVNQWVMQHVEADEAIALPYYSIARIMAIPDSATVVEMDAAFNNGMAEAVMDRVQFHFGELNSQQQYELEPFAVRVFGEDEMIHQVRYRGMAAMALAGKTPKPSRRLHYYTRVDARFVPPGVVYQADVKSLWEAGELGAIVLPPGDVAIPLLGDSIAFNMWPSEEIDLWRVAVPVADSITAP